MKGGTMKQLAFGFMLEVLPAKIDGMEDRIKDELLMHMTAAIIEVFENERGKTDDNVSEQL